MDVKAMTPGARVNDQATYLVMGKDIIRNESFSMGQCIYSVTKKGTNFGITPHSLTLDF